jgi:hypothetical protein
MEISLTKTDLGPAAKALVEKIASATGTLYAPLETIFQALADMTANKIKTKGEIEIAEVRRRALERLVAEEIRKQNNLESIYGQTYQLLDPEVSGTTIERMDEDWIVYHSEKARLVSGKEMQTLWARVMANEAEAPGSYSKRTLDILSSLEKSEAHLFTSVCRFIVRAHSVVIPAILFDDDLRRLPNIYLDLGLDSTALLHLATIGLVRYTSPFLSNNVWTYEKPYAVELEYFGDHRTFDIHENDKTGKCSIDYGVVALTKVGQQLAGIAGAKPVEGFFDFLEAEWEKVWILRRGGPSKSADEEDQWSVDEQQRWIDAQESDDPEQMGS